MAYQPLLAPVTLQLPAFEGPLELLLTLLEKRRLEITAVSLAQVADQYLEHVAGMAEHRPDYLADFLVVGARLLLIKSRALLPGAPQDAYPDEQDYGQELAARLQEYTLFKAAAAHLHALETRDARIYARPPHPGTTPRLAPLSAQELAKAFASVLRSRIGSGKPVAEVARRLRASVEAKITLIRASLGDANEVGWEEVAGADVDDLIATFLAVLELIRRGELEVRQTHAFGPLRLFRVAEVPTAVSRPRT